ncbi:hypothetical protein ACFQU3_11390 [Terrabacter sp. GCM10028922]|uniref:hypothetical protein n=1 Tax=Terrabacter sp. GCM10028922 TaxID=3273428 RepID=UPI00361FD8E3
MTETHAPTKRANRVADWIEIECLVLDRAIGVDALNESGKAHGYRPADVALGLTTMSRRSAVLGGAYPFRAANGAASTQYAIKMPWSALLLMSSESPARRTLEIGVAAAHLERITAQALRQLYGADTHAIRFAWPSEDGRPPEFPDAVRWLADRMNVRIGTAYRPPYNKDGGVDVVAWRPFPDGRSGFPVLLVQCTLEKDYAHKAADVDTRVWSGWLALDVDPSTALAIPDVVAAGEEWRALAARTVVLDRIRLASLVGAAESAPALGQVFAWADGVLTELRDKR